MIKIENTPNLTGVRISGTFDDLQELVDAIYSITVNEDSEKNMQYINISMRLLGLSYEVRHASQGDREIDLVENYIDEETMKFHGKIAPKTNVEYACHYLYPEMIFCMMAINELILLRIRELTKAKYIFKEMFHQKVVWDKSIAVLRTFQSVFAECVQGILTEQSFRIWIKEVTQADNFFYSIMTRYMDLMNVEYIDLDKEQRLKNFSKFTRRITKYNHQDDYMELSEMLHSYAAKHQCDVSDIEINGLEYPEEINW